MPFGLTNAPATFQSCMNHTFKAQVPKYLLVFFDDILIYIKTWEEHLKHLDEVLEILEEQSLYAKMSKCEFGMKDVVSRAYNQCGRGTGGIWKILELSWIGVHRRKLLN